MYWNNSWYNNYNSCNFLNKSLFLENLFSFLFSEKVFSFFFKTLLDNSIKSTLFKSSLVKTSSTFNKNFPLSQTTKTKYNFTRLWLIKFNNFILISCFCFFFFKIKKSKVNNKKSFFFKKSPTIFWKKKRGTKVFKSLYSNYLNF